MYNVQAQTELFGTEVIWRPGFCRLLDKLRSEPRCASDARVGRPSQAFCHTHCRLQKLKEERVKGERKQNNINKNVQNTEKPKPQHFCHYHIKNPCFKQKLFYADLLKLCLDKLI